MRSRFEGYGTFAGFCPGGGGGGGVYHSAQL